MPLKPQLILTLATAAASLAIPTYLYFGQVTQLDCDRRSQSCQITVSNAVSSTLQHTFSLSSLKGAAVEKNVTRSVKPSKSYTSHQLVLLVSPVPIPWSSRVDPEIATMAQQAQTINTFLKTPSQPQLTVIQDNRAVGKQMAGVAGGVGLVVSGAIAGAIHAQKASQKRL